MTNMRMQVIINALLTEEMAEEITQCILSEGYSTKAASLLELQAVERYSQHAWGDWTEFKITCYANGSSLASLQDPRADVQLRNGLSGSYPVKLETLATQLTGGVALCGPSVYSSRVWIHDYVRHYEALGVDEFHFYLPQGPVVEEFLVKPERAEGVFEITAGSLSTEKAEPFVHPKVCWHNFTASPGGQSFNLRAGNNDCLSRLKYSHEYAIVADLDEFLHLTHLAGSTKIKDVMDRFLPDGVASLGFADLYYPRGCPISSVSFEKEGMPKAWTGHYPDAYQLHYSVQLTKDGAETYWNSHPSRSETLPIEANPFDMWVKSVVRVSAVFSVNYHGPEELLATSRSHAHYLPHYVVHFKHIRYLGSVACMFGSAVRDHWFFQPDAVLHLADI